MMNEVTKQWKAEVIEKINLRTADWSDEEKLKLDLPYIKQVTDLVATKHATRTELDDFNEKLDRLITWIPIRSEDGQLFYGLYSKELSDFKSEVGKRYQLVSETHYRELFLPIGIALGISFGLLFKNLALGLALGVAIGFTLGTLMKYRAEKSGRIIE